MAYAVAITTSQVAYEGELWTRVDVVETDVSATDEWSVSAFPAVATISLYEAALTVPGLATTIRPALGLVAGWMPDTLNEVAVTDGAAARVRNADDLRVLVAGGVLRGRSTPNGQAAEIRTRLAYRRGHGLG